MTQFLIYIYFSCWIIAIFLYRRNINLFYIYALKLGVYVVLIFFRLFFLNYLLNQNSFKIPLVFFILLLFMLVSSRKIPSFFSKIFAFFKKPEKNRLLEDILNISNQQEIFRRKYFPLKLELFLYFYSRIFYNLFTREQIIAFYFLPHFLFIIFFFKDIFSTPYSSYLSFSLAFYSFMFLFSKLYLRIIIFSGVWGQLYGIFSITLPEHYMDFYKYVKELQEGFCLGTAIYQLFRDSNGDYLAADCYLADFQGLRDNCYLYKNFFMKALDNHQIFLNLQFFMKTMVYLYFWLSLEVFCQNSIKSFFLQNSHIFTTVTDYLFFDFFLTVDFHIHLFLIFLFWFFRHLQKFISLFYDKNLTRLILEGWYIPGLEDFFNKKYNTTFFTDFYQNYDIEKDLLSHKEKELFMITLIKRMVISLGGLIKKYW